MARTLFELALSKILKSTGNSITKDDAELEIVRKILHGNSRPEIRYRNIDCCNQLHFFTATPHDILKLLDENGDEMFDVAMGDPWIER